jgi:hypothetical protein
VWEELGEKIGVAMVMKGLRWCCIEVFLPARKEYITSLLFFTRPLS